MAKTQTVESMDTLVLTCDLVSAGPLLFGKRIITELKEGEAYDVFEERTWRERMHVDENGELFIPGVALKKTLAATACYLSEKIKGKGQATYTKHFKSGLMIFEDLHLGIKAKDVTGVPMDVPAQPQKPKGAKVTRIFPIVPRWTASVEIIVTDPTLLSHMEKVRQYVSFSGKFVGLLSMRIGNGGQFGRYSAENFAERDLVA